MTLPAPGIWFVGPYPPIKGGVSQHGGCLVEALGQRGLEIGIVSWRKQYPRFLYPGAEIPIPRDLTTHSLEWWSPRSWISSQRQIRRADSVVIPYVSPFHVVPLKTVLKSVSGYRLALVHNALPHERLPLGQSALGWFLRSIDGVITHSETVADAVRASRADIPLSVVPHPPNMALTSSQLPGGIIRLLYFGYIRRYKGVDLLISALGKIRRMGAEMKLTVAGEPWGNASDLVELASLEGVADLVDFRFRYVPEAEVQSLFGSHHLVVQPYRSASQSGVIPLAFAAGRGVVVTPVDGLVEYVRQGHNGVVATAVNADAIAEGIAKAAKIMHRLSAGAASSTATWVDVANAVIEMAQLDGHTSQ